MNKTTFSSVNAACEEANRGAGLPYKPGLYFDMTENYTPKEIVFS